MGSEKGVSRRRLERPLVEYAPWGVRPIFGIHSVIFLCAMEHLLGPEW